LDIEFSLFQPPEKISRRQDDNLQMQEDTDQTSNGSNPGMLKSDWRINLSRNESFERVHHLDTNIAGNRERRGVPDLQLWQLLSATLARTRV